jgi:hypothetical protein
LEEDLVSTIIAQTKILFLNLEGTLNSLEENQLYDEKICDWPLGEQIFHTLGSLDQWFINPNNYHEAPAIRKRKSERLTKSDLMDYYNSIRGKIVDYLESLSIGSLIESPQDCRFNRLALILGQYRHLMYHIGIIHGCLRVYTGGKNPAYYGLRPPIEPAEKG